MIEYLCNESNEDSVQHKEKNCVLPKEYVIEIKRLLKDYLKIINRTLIGRRRDIIVSNELITFRDILVNSKSLPSVIIDVFEDHNSEKRLFEGILPDILSEKSKTLNLLNELKKSIKRESKGLIMKESRVKCPKALAPPTKKEKSRIKNNKRMSPMPKTKTIKHKDINSTPVSCKISVSSD
jgi:hypothetical protein